MLAGVEVVDRVEVITPISRSWPGRMHSPSSMMWRAHDQSAEVPRALHGSPPRCSPSRRPADPDNRHSLTWSQLRCCIILLQPSYKPTDAWACRLSCLGVNPGHPTMHKPKPLEAQPNHRSCPSLPSGGPPSNPELPLRSTRLWASEARSDAYGMSSAPSSPPGALRRQPAPAHLHMLLHSYTPLM